RPSSGRSASVTVRSRVLRLGLVVALGAVLLSTTVLVLGTMADGVAEPTTSGAAVPTGPLRDRSLPGTSHARPHDFELAFEEDFDGDELDADTWGTCHWWQAVGCTI